MRLFSKASCWCRFNKYCISWLYLMDLISYDFFRNLVLNFFYIHLLDVVKKLVHLRSKFDRPDFMWLFSKVSYRTVFNKCFIQSNKALQQRNIFDGLDFMWRFSKVCFKYLEAKQIILLMYDLSNGYCFKLALIFLKWFECFSKRFWFPTPKKILNFYFS